MSRTAELHHLFLKSEGVSTDSRGGLNGKLFFALKGDHFDGNVFAEKAAAQGASMAVVSDPALAGKEKMWVVEDTLTALQDLAAFHRQYLGLPIISITGSNGKTTTKELIAAVLSKKYRVVYTRGNLNNHIGVPLTLLRMDRQTEIGVVEMGANHQKEIEQLCRIARPDYGYITNFGKAHLEGFGGFEGVIKGKSELYDFLRINGKTIFVNTDDEIQVRQSVGASQIRFSRTGDTGYRIETGKANPFVEVCFDGLTVKSHLLGSYNAKNISAAVAVGKYFKVPPEAIKAAVEAYIPDNNRSQLIEKGSNRILLDAYNANPTSMRLAIENFVQYPADHRVVMLGDMFEVGETALAEHQQIVNLLERSAIDRAFVCGETFAQTQTKKVLQYPSFEALQKAVRQAGIHSSLILIKGSRGMQMERLLNVL